MSIVSNIKLFKKKFKKTLFTTPSHLQEPFIIPEAKKILGERFFDVDFSEFDGMDNLSCPSGCILKTMQKIAETYASSRTYLLTNGSTSGILALMNACLTAGDKVIINRNCHKSVYNGLVLTGAFPIWPDVEIDEEWDFIKPVSSEKIEQTILSNTGVKAVIITNPTYEGMLVDVAEISRICAKHNVILIIDEAHGALWNFNENLPYPAIKSGADASVQSLHKTTGALTPCALLHLSKTSKISCDKVQEALNLINTTSPSYPLMADIELTVDYLDSKHGRRKLRELFELISNFRKKIMYVDNIRVYCFKNDFTKLFIQIEGLSGIALSSILYNKYKIEVEMANEFSILCITGIGTSEKNLEKLAKALIKISKNVEKLAQPPSLPTSFLYFHPEIACTPRQAYYAKSIELNLNDAVGKVAQSFYCEYPPGIPILVGGEIIQSQHVEYLKQHYDKIKVLV